MSMSARRGLGSPYDQITHGTTRSLALPGPQQPGEPNHGQRREPSRPEQSSRWARWPAGTRSVDGCRYGRHLRLWFFLDDPFLLDDTAGISRVSDRRCLGGGDKRCDSRAQSETFGKRALRWSGPGRAGRGRGGRFDAGRADAQPVAISPQLGHRPVAVPHRLPAAVALHRGPGNRRRLPTAVVTNHEGSGDQAVPQPMRTWSFQCSVGGSEEVGVWLSTTPSRPVR